MAYKIIITKKFENSAAKISQWIEDEWSLKSSLEFDEKLTVTLNELILNPKIGRFSSKKNIRSIPVTKHNRIYYKITKAEIIILDLFESKQNPKRNKYE